VEGGSAETSEDPHCSQNRADGSLTGAAQLGHAVPWALPHLAQNRASAATALPQTGHDGDMLTAGEALERPAQRPPR